MRLLALLFLLGSTWPAGAEVGKACLSAPIGLLEFGAGRCFREGETEALWEAPIDDGAGKPLSTVFGKSLEGATKTIGDCTDVQDLDAESLDALAAATTPELLKVRRACDAVLYFGVGHPSESTNLRAPGVDLGDTARVGVSVLPDGLSLPEGWDGGITLAEAAKAGKLKLAQVPGAPLAFDYKDRRYVMTEAGRADMSGDGIEDMLVMVDEIVNGERRHAYALGLTRLEAADPLVRIDEFSE